MSKTTTDTSSKKDDQPMMLYCPLGHAIFVNGIKRSVLEKKWDFHVPQDRKAISTLNLSDQELDEAQFECRRCRVLDKFATDLAHVWENVIYNRFAPHDSRGVTLKGFVCQSKEDGKLYSVDAPGVVRKLELLPASNGLFYRVVVQVDMTELGSWAMEPDVTTKRNYHLNALMWVPQFDAWVVILEKNVPIQGYTSSVLDEHLEDDYQEWYDHHVRATFVWPGTQCKLGRKARACRCYKHIIRSPKCIDENTD